MSDIKFEIVKEYGQLGNGTYSPELNKVKWNEGETKWDIRKWSEDGKTPYKGITFDDSEAIQLVSLLSVAINADKNKTPLYEISFGKATVKIFNVFGNISDNGKMTKQLLYVNWGSKLKYDLRGWSSDYKKCSKGITLDDDECSKLLSLLEAELCCDNGKNSALPKGISVDLDDELLI